MQTASCFVNNKYGTINGTATQMMKGTYGSTQAQGGCCLPPIPLKQVSTLNANRLQMLHSILFSQSTGLSCPY